MEETIINRVANSPLKSIDLGEYMNQSPKVEIDLKDVLFQGLILREKDFRQFLKEKDWSEYEGKNVRIYCSEDAVIPIWAYMLLVSKLQEANLVVQGSKDDLEKALIRQGIDILLREDWTDAKVVIKGCGDIRNKEYAYTEMSKSLIPKVTSLMYGEPCSTVPVYKRKKV